MHDYYDYHPRVQLQRHLVLTGYFTEDTRHVGFQLAALTGLGVTDLDRTVEHFAGQSMRQLIAFEGEAQYRRLEAQHLQRLLASRPYAILTLGDGALIDPINLNSVLDLADLVVLDRDLSNCYWHIQRLIGEQGSWHPLYPGPVEGFEQIRPFIELRQPGFAKAPQHIDRLRFDRRESVELLMKQLDVPFDVTPYNVP